MQASAIYNSLKDKIVAITGGASGIGEAYVRAFVDQARASRSSISIKTQAKRWQRAELPLFTVQCYRHSSVKKLLRDDYRTTWRRRCAD
ncbi:hypothetical protein O0544_06170 [Edwardsiella anguillarum]|nr:hypothetical protein [Edwardsiella anguillarum]